MSTRGIVLGFTASAHPATQGSPIVTVKRILAALAVLGALAGGTAAATASHGVPSATHFYGKAPATHFYG